ncbi:MAG: ATP-binding protein [Gammaproteobacteria bacterium]
MLNRASLFHSLRFRLIASVVTIEIIMLSLLVWNNMSIIQTTHTDRLRDTAASMLQQIATTSGNYMMAVDYATLEGYLSKIINYKELTYIVVVDRDDEAVISLGEAPSSPWPRAESHPAQVNDGVYDVTTEISVADLPMGRLLMGFSLSLMEDAIRKSRDRGITIAAIEILLTVIVTVLIGLGLTRRLSMLADAAAKVEAGDYSVSVPTETDDEVGKTAHAFNRMVAEVSSRTQQLEQAEAKTQNLFNENRMLVHASLVIQEEERKNLARELHDEMGQCLTAIQADAELIRDISQRDISPRRGDGSDDRIVTSANAILDVSSRVYDVVHSMMRRLRPTILDNLGLVEALKDEIDAWNSRHPETRCEFNYTGDLDELDEQINIMLYRIVQESLTNIAKHASADFVSVKINQQGKQLQLIIEDNGKGTDLTGDDKNKGLGLIGMRERVETIDGSFEIVSSPGNGFEICINVPFKRAA